MSDHLDRMGGHTRPQTDKDLEFAEKWGDKLIPAQRRGISAPVQTYVEHRPCGLDHADDPCVEYGEGNADGHEQEKKRIVAWLRSYSQAAPNDHPHRWADAIEAGRHDREGELPT